MEKRHIEGFDIIGIKTRTANDGRAGKDIPMLWGKFMENGVKDRIPNKMDDSIYCLYSNYEGDHLQPYDVIIGCKVSATDQIPDGMILHHVDTGNSAKFVAKGSLVKGEAVVKTWFQIWDADINRKFSTDYEVYDERSSDIQNAEVDIFVSVN